MCAPRWFQRTSWMSRRSIRGMRVLIFWTALRGSQNSSLALSQVMNRGFWSMTPRQNAKFGSGSLQTLPVPRKREWANPKSNRFFFYSQGIVHKEFVPSGQTVNQTFYREVLEKGDTCATRHCTYLNAAPRQRPMSHGSLHQLIFGRKKHSCVSSSLLFAGSHSLWLIFIPPAQKPLERTPFWYFG